MRMNFNPATSRPRGTEPDSPAELALGKATRTLPPAPARDTMLSSVYAAAHTTKEHPMTLMRRFFHGQPWYFKLAGACLLLAGLTALSLLLPGRHFVPGPEAAYAGTNGYLLVYDFGAVSMDQARPVLDELQRRVAAFKETNGLQVDGATWESKVGIVAEARHERTITRESDGTESETPLPPTPPEPPAAGDSEMMDRILAFIQLEDANLLEELQAELATINGLPEAKVVDATWFAQEGLPLPGEEGIRVSLGLHGNEHVFAFPATATESEIESAIMAWFAENHPDLKAQVDVTIKNDGDQREVRIEIKRTSGDPADMPPAPEPPTPPTS